MPNLLFDVEARGDASELAVMAAEAEALRKALKDLDSTRVKARIDLDGASAKDIASIAKLRDSLAEIDGKTARARVDVSGIPTSAEASAIRRTAKALRELDGQDAICRVEVIGDLPNPTEIRRAARALKELEGIGLIRIHIEVTGAEEGLAAVTALGAALRRLPSKTTTEVNVKTDADRILRSFEGIAGAIAKVGVGIAALGALPQLASLGAAAVTASGAIGLLPGVLTVAAAGFAALKIATAGFGDALKAMGDPAKFAEALKGLAPSAQQAAIAIKDLQPAFNSMKLDLQQRLFDGLGKSIQALGTTYVPILSERFGRIADAANVAATGVAELMSQANRIADIKTIGTGAANVFENLSAAVKPLVAAFIDLATVGVQTLADMTKGAGSAAQKFAEFISSARESGQLKQWIQGGIDTLKQLATIAGNVGSILKSVFDAAKSSGADLVSTLQRVTGEIKTWASSVQGQTALTNFFKTIRETVDAAMPGFRALGDAVTSIINKLADSGIGERIGTAFSKIAEVVGPIASTLANLAITVIGPLISALGSLAPILGPIATGLLGVWTAAKLMQGINAITPLITGFVTALRNIGTATASGGLMAGIKTLATSLGAGGILGIALAGAGIALGIFAQQQGQAAAKAQEHRAALDSLAGTLDKYSGAVTQATINEKASQLAKDGTLEKVKQLGVSTEDYVRATLGVPGALERVNTQLTAHTAAIIGASDQYQKWGPKLQGIGLSLDDIAAAASGNAPAMEKVQKALAGINNETDKTTFGHVINDLLGMGEQSAQLARELGITTDEFKKIQEQTRLAGEASNDFAMKLDFLKQGLAGLKDGAAPTKEFASALAGLSTSAGEAATRAGDAAKALNGVKAGGQAAYDSMVKSRQAFVEAATAALGSEEAANALATQLGLIPEAARINFETNATGVQAEMNTLQQQIAAVPGAKTVTISTLSADAEKQLETFGIKVERLKNGQVVLNLEDADAVAKFQAFQTTVNTAKTAPTLDLNTATGQQKADAFKSYVDGLTGIAKADADTAPGTQKANDLKTHIDGITAIMKANADITPGTASGDQLQAHINGLVGIMTADANNAPGTAKGDALRQYISGLIAIMTADANSQPGTAKGDALKAYVDRLQAAITVGATDNATGQAGSIRDAINRMTATIKVGVTYTGGAGTIAGGATTSGSVTGAIGGIVKPMADGGVLRMADGGNIRRLRPMAGGVAQVVAPNTWRVVGDRVTDDEAFIPLNGSSRSKEILRQAADALGYGVVPRDVMNGVASRPPTSVVVNTAAMAPAAGRNTLDLSAIRGEFAGALGQLRADLTGAVREQTAAVQAARPINVVAQPGSEVATARATQLALRLS